MAYDKIVYRYELCTLTLGTDHYTLISYYCVVTAITINPLIKVILPVTNLKRGAKSSFIPSTCMTCGLVCPISCRKLYRSCKGCSVSPTLLVNFPPYSRYNSFAKHLHVCSQNNPVYDFMTSPQNISLPKFIHPKYYVCCNFSLPGHNGFCCGINGALYWFGIRRSRLVHPKK